MARIAEDLATEVDNYVPETFEPLEDGVYTLRFEEDVDVKVGAAGPYWTWKFVAYKDDNPEMTRTKATLFHRTSLSPKAAFKLAETFKAFGVSANTDTEDLVGQTVRGKVIQKVIEAGKRQGEIGNELDELLPLNAEIGASAPADKVSTAKGGKTEKPLF